MMLVVLVGSRPTLALAVDPAAVDDVLALTGAKRQIDQIDGHLAMNRKYSFANLAPEVKSRLDAIFAAAYDPATIFADVRGFVLREFDDDKGARAIAFLRTPLAQTMTRLEVAADAAEAEPELRAFTLRLRSAPPDAGRLALLQRLDVAARQTELFLAFTMSSLRSFVAIANVARPPNARLSPEQLGKEIDTARAQFERMAKGNVLVRALFTYRSVTDDDLRAYVEFHESEEGRWLVDLLSRAALAAHEHSRTTATQRALDAIQKDDDRRCVGLPCRPTP